MENKEDFVLLILLENKSQTVRRMNNDTEIGHRGNRVHMLWKKTEGEWKQTLVFQKCLQHLLEKILNSDICFYFVPCLKKPRQFSCGIFINIKEVFSLIFINFVTLVSSSSLHSEGTSCLA
jgi:hypothetical protein